MDRWAGKVAVITGASAGIGLATAKTLVHHGLIVVGLARRRSKMESEMKDVKGEGKFYGLECDLSNEQQVNNAFDWIKKNVKTIHVLINNAGIINPGKIADVRFDDLKKVIDVNLTGLLLCSKLAINVMKEGSHESHIININSTAGHRVGTIPTGYSTNIYSATKFAVTALSRIMELELYGGNIRVTNLSPGAIKTELTDSLCEHIPRIKNLDLLEPEDVADAIVYVLGTPSRVLIEELIIKPTKAPY